MNQGSTQITNTERASRWHLLFSAIASASFALNGMNANAAPFMPAEIRASQGSGEFAAAAQYALAHHLRPPRSLRASHLEFAIGSISTASENRAFVSFGPVWRIPVRQTALFLDLGFSPTLIAGETFDGRALGGNLHFTSSAALGARYGELDSLSISLRVSHTSNGGLSSTNPGLDMIGLNFAINFAER